MADLSSAGIECTARLQSMRQVQLSLWRGPAVALQIVPMSVMWGEVRQVAYPSTNRLTWSGSVGLCRTWSATPMAASAVVSGSYRFVVEPRLLLMRGFAAERGSTPLARFRAKRIWASSCSNWEHAACASCRAAASRSVALRRSVWARATSAVRVASSCPLVATRSAAS